MGSNGFIKAHIVVRADKKNQTKMLIDTILKNQARFNY